MWFILEACAEPACEEVSGNVCAVAGTGDQGFNGDGLSPAETWLYLPTALAWSPEGELVVVDYNNMRVRALADPVRSLAGNGEHAYATPGAGVLESALENPIDVAWSPAGAMTISASHEARVLLVEDGVVGVYAGTGEEGDDGDGGPATAARFSAELGGIAWDDDGRLAIVDTAFGTLRVVQPDGTVERWATGMSRPQGVSWIDGAFWVADTGGGRIWRVDAEGATVEAEGFVQPWAVADVGGVVVAADNRVWRLDGEVIAGSGADESSGDGGPAVDAGFATVSDLLPAPEGGFYLAELRGAVVRRVIP